MVWESNGILNIDNLENQILKEIRVFDMQGKLVFVGNENYCNLNHLTRGIYMLMVSTDKRIEFKKIFKQ
jgi:hypothetical protein